MTFEEKDKKLEALIGDIRYYVYYEDSPEIYLDGKFKPQELIEIARIVGEYGP